MPDRIYPVVQRPYLPDVHAPEALAGADIIEVRVELIPLRWDEAFQSHMPKGDRVGGQVQIARIEARDHRAVFSIVRQMIHELFRHWMGIDVGL